MSSGDYKSIEQLQSEGNFPDPLDSLADIAAQIEARISEAEAADDKRELRELLKMKARIARSLQQYGRG